MREALERRPRLKERLFSEEAPLLRKRSRPRSRRRVSPKRRRDRGTRQTGSRGCASPDVPAPRDMGRPVPSFRAGPRTSSGLENIEMQGQSPSPIARRSLRQPAISRGYSAAQHERPDPKAEIAARFKEARALIDEPRARRAVRRRCEAASRRGGPRQGHLSSRGGAMLHALTARQSRDAESRPTAEAGTELSAN